jgi:hypothetical protein
MKYFLIVLLVLFFIAFVCCVAVKVIQLAVVYLAACVLLLWVLKKIESNIPL